MMQKIIIFAFWLTFCQNALSDDKQNSQQLEELVKSFKSMEMRFETLESENKALKERMKTLENKDVSVYFSAYLDSGGYIGSDSEDFPITYNNVLLNHGNGFDAERGTFTAPLSGIYSFRFDGRQSYHGNTGEANRVRAYKNYFYFLGMYDSGLEYGQIQHLHFSFEEKLNIGDTIDLRLYPDDWLYADSNHRISFSGELLYVE